MPDAEDRHICTVIRGSGRGTGGADQRGREALGRSERIRKVCSDRRVYKRDGRR